MMLANKLRAATAAAAGGGEPVGIEFDGTNDYLSRSSDLVGNADGKTFTLSFWVYFDSFSTSPTIIMLNDAGDSFNLFVTASGQIIIRAENAGGTKILEGFQGSAEYLPLNTWLNIIVSSDMAAGASSFKIAVNDEVLSTVSTSFFTNDTIDFTGSTHLLGAFNTSPASELKGRLAGVYLDYTYRDLSVEANRRDFIDADGRYVKPPTTGIISVPMDDPEDPGRNDGTGGDFTLNGVVAQAGRGPNQYNAPASTFDGSADYLTKTIALTGIADGKAFTFAGTVKTNSATTNQRLIGFATSTSDRFAVDWRTPGEIQILARNAAGANILLATTSVPVLSKDTYHSIVVSVDLSDTAKRRVLIDGVEATVTWSTYTDDIIDFAISSNARYRIGANSDNTPSLIFNGELSDFWFDTTYIDLSADNPFYDSETGKPKDLGVDGSNPTGSAPLIYLPLRADDAGSNKGTGGDFTVNSGPYTGARGPSEFWGESAEFNGSTQYLSRTSGLTSVSDGKAFTLAMAVLLDSTAGSNDFLLLRTSTNEAFNITQSTTSFLMQADNATGTRILNAQPNSPPFGTATWYTILVSIDLSDIGKRHVYFDGASEAMAWNTYTNDDIDFTGDSVYIASDAAGFNIIDGKIGFLWFNTEYIDFSQEANRLKFFDAFNYPVDLGEDGSLPTGNQPLIYMNNDFHLGTNLGSGGNFTPQNTPTDGGFVKG